MESSITEDGDAPAADVVVSDAPAANFVAGAPPRVSGVSLFTQSRHDPAESKATQVLRAAKVWREMGDAARAPWLARAQAASLARGHGIEQWVIQDIWDEEEDEELLEFVRASGAPLTIACRDVILALEPTPATMIFTESGIVQRPLVRAPSSTPILVRVRRKQAVAHAEFAHFWSNCCSQA